MPRGTSTRCLLPMYTWLFRFSSSAVPFNLPGMSLYLITCTQGGPSDPGERCERLNTSNTKFPLKSLPSKVGKLNLDRSPLNDSFVIVGLSSMMVLKGAQCSYINMSYSIHPLLNFINRTLESVNKKPVKRTRKTFNVRHFIIRHARA